MKLSPITLSVAGLCSWLLLAGSAMAHPHVFMQYELGLRQQAGQFQGFEMTWTVDTDNSRLILDEYDANRDGVLQSAEAYQIASALEQDMADYAFYTEARLDGQPVKIHEVQELRTGLEQGHIVYRLFLPCAAPKGDHTLSFKAIDPSNYVALTPAAEPAKLLGDGPLRMQIVQAARQMYDPWTFKLQ